MQVRIVVSIGILGSVIEIGPIQPEESNVRMREMTAEKVTHLK